MSLTKLQTTPFFRRAYVEISNICNLKCSFCPTVERASQVMSPTLFNKVAAQLTGMVDEVCLHLMGEPLNHPEFSQILQLCREYQLPVNLTTNGLMLTGTRRELALSPIVRQVNLSLQSFAANFTGQDVSGYMQRIFQFTRLAQEQRPDLYINLRLWDLEDAQTLSTVNAAVRASISAEFGVDLEGLAIDIRRKKNLQLGGRIYLNFDSRFTWPSLDLPKRLKPGFCHGLSSHFGVHADGTVVPCCLDKEAVINLGQVTEQPLQEILFGPRATAIRAGFDRGEPVEDLCQRCTFIDRFDRKAQRLRRTTLSS